MDLRSEILKENSKPQALKIAHYIGNDPERFYELMQLFLAKEYRVTQRAAWILSHCCDKHPALILPHLSNLISNLKGNPPVAVRRNTVRILQFIDIPEELMGELADHCFKYLSSADEPVAVKVFSMTILANIVKVFPELAQELRILIEDQMPYGSAGFISRGNKILKSLPN